MKPRIAFALWILLIGAGSADRLVWGQLSEPTRARLAVELRSAAKDLDAAALPKFESVLSEAEDAQRGLAQYLNSISDPQRAANWLDYINFDELTNAVGAEASTQEQGKIAREVYWRLARNVEGLERRAVLRLRSVLKRLYEASFFDDPSKIVKTVGLQLERMAETLEESDDVLTPDEAAQLNYLLNLINSTSLVPNIQSNLRSSIGQPNVRVSVGSSVVGNAVTRPVSEQNPSDECILGTRVISQTQLNGNVTAQLIPSMGAARIQLMLSANFQSLGTGYNRKVRVANRGFGTVTATRELILNENGIDLGPVETNANLDSQILGIQHPLRLVRRIAARRAAEQKGQANAIGESRLEGRVSTEFAEQIDAQVSRGNLLPQAQAADVLTRLDLEQPGKKWSSTSNYVRLDLTVRNDKQTTTAVPPPPVVDGYDVVVQIHESAINNLTAELLGDRLLRDGEIRQFLASLVPADLRTQSPVPISGLFVVGSKDEEPDADKLEITFRPLRPIVFEARDGEVRVGLRGSRFQKGDQVLNKSLEITAAYKPVRKSDGTVRLERNGEVEVVIPTAGGRGLSISDRAFRTAIERRFENVFPAVLLDPPFDLVNPATLGKPPKPIKIWAIQPRNGWLTIHLR